MHDFKGYTNLVEIGRGGMATVYRATSASGGLVAIKVLSLARSTDPRSLRRFQQEMMLGATLQHPNIVRVLDFSEGDSTPGTGSTPPFIVMEYVPGDSLDRRLQRGRTIAPDQFARYLTDVASALDYAHARGIVHRDVKPSNVLIKPDGRAMIVDFGIAKSKDATVHTATQSRVGSVPYMSPEQADAAPELTPASDIYSLGVTAFHALTGNTPFTGPSDVAVARMHLESPPPHLEDFNPAISRAVCSAVLTALQKQPSARYKSAGSFALAFSSALRQANISIGDKFHPLSPPAPRTAARATTASASHRGGIARYLPLGAALAMLTAGGLLLSRVPAIEAQPTSVALPTPVLGPAITREPTPPPPPPDTATPRPTPAPSATSLPATSTVVPATSTAMPTIAPPPTALPNTPRPGPTARPTVTPRPSPTPRRPTPTRVR